ATLGRTVEVFAKEAPARVLELEQWGAVFDRTPEGRIMQRAFGGHSFRRLAHIGDRTGMELLRTLQYKAISMDIKVFQEVTITRLLMDGSRVAGAMGYYRADGHFILLKAKAIVLATGGWGKVYKVTSNSWESTGDGAAMAYRIGADLKDMEMVQFHPTGMVWPPGVAGLLVTEGVRGEGGLLYNSEKERFMKRYDPERQELSTRDVVARSIFKEVQAGRGTPHGGAWLDISHKKADFIKQKLPGMYEQILTLGDIDITKQPFEVAPTCHYQMGGVQAHAETCATTVPGLFAAGEVACGLHGANRLGGNSLADILVFGRRAGIAARDYATSLKKAPEIDDTQVEAEVARILEPFNRPDGENPYAIHQELQEAMSTHAAIVRSEDDLKVGLNKILSLKERAKRMGIKGGRVYNPGWHAVFDVENMLLLSELIVRGALERKESRGGHWRSDYPDELPEMGKWNFVHQYSEDGDRITRVPVPEMPPELAEICARPVAPGREKVAGSSQVPPRKE
ncbi:MAG: fumarate reductase/succinate dehydrogenase flavoprotein subunit, partial [Sulfobacillus thermosulfidooxidans]